MMTTRAPKGPTRQLLGAQVEYEIRTLIAERQLREGDPLPSEGELAEYFGVSKSTVREAVRRLEALGHVNVVHGVGLKVGSFSIKAVVDSLPFEFLDATRTLRDILDVRTVIEENFLAQAAAAMDEDQLDHLERIVTKMEIGSPEGDLDPDIDAEFHDALYRPLDNRFVTDLITTFWQLFHTARHTFEFRRNFHAVQEHRDIVTALRTGDEARIRAAMRAHFRQLQTQLERYAAEPGDGGGPDGEGAPDGGAPPDGGAS